MAGATLARAFLATVLLGSAFASRAATLFFAGDSWVAQENGIKAARLQLYTWGATDYPVEKREIWKTENAHTRPHLIQFNRCKNIHWSGGNFANYKNIQISACFSY